MINWHQLLTAGVGNVDAIREVDGVSVVDVNESQQISMSGAPPAGATFVIGETPQRLRLSEIAPGSKIEIELPAGGNSRPFNLEIPKASGITLSIKGAPSESPDFSHWPPERAAWDVLLESGGGDNDCQLELENVLLGLGKQTGSQEHWKKIVVNNAILHSVQAINVENVIGENSCGFVQVTMKSLSIPSAAKLFLNHSRVHTLRSGAGRIDIRGTLTVARVDGPATFHIPDGSTVAIGDGKDISVEGAGTLRVGNRGTVLGLTFLDDFETAAAPRVRPYSLGVWLRDAPQEFESQNRQRVSLCLSYGAQAVKVRGWFELGDIGHARLHGHPDRSCAMIEAYGSTPDPELAKWLENSIVQDVRIDSRLRSRTLWNACERSATFDPIIDLELYRKYNFSRTVLSRILSPSERLRWRDRSEYVENREYAEFLARLCESKGASGVHRCRSRWGVYRLRQIGAGRVERLLLAFYRPLGYGEQIGPPLLAWLILLAGLTGLSLGDRPLDFGADGLLNVGAVLGFWLVPTIGLLGLSEVPQGVDKEWAYLGHALLAIPFLTFVLTLRKMLKIRDVAN